MSNSDFAWTAVLVGILALVLSALVCLAVHLCRRARVLQAQHDVEMPEMEMPKMFGTAQCDVEIPETKKCEMEKVEIPETRMPQMLAVTEPEDSSEEEYLRRNVEVLERRDEEDRERRSVRSAVLQRPLSRRLLPARHGPELPALASQLLQEELQLGALSPGGPFLTHFLGCKFAPDRRLRLAIDLTDSETRGGALEAVQALAQQLDVAAASHGPSSSASSEARSGRRGRRGRGRAGRSGSGPGAGEQQAGGNQQLCRDHVGLMELLLQERNSGRSPKDAAGVEGFKTTRQLLLEQLDQEEPYHLPPDGGSSRNELDGARRDLRPYSLKEARAKDGTGREKIQVVVHVEIGRPIFGDEQRRILRGANAVFRARVGQRKEDGTWARGRPELFLCCWEPDDEVVFMSEDEDSAAPAAGKAGSDSTPSTRSSSGTRQAGSSSASGCPTPEPNTYGRVSPDGEAGEPSALYPSTPDSLSPRGPLSEL